ncbi:MAG TPA: hypothetical protein VIX37_02505 [Candidatus Sulfotelmatobacter sp.]
MARKITPRDPEAALVRRATAARRAGLGAQCGCGEARPGALVKNSEPKICHECRRKKEGKTTADNHHVFGAANSPTTVALPANDHCAELNAAQYDWPKKVRENPDGSPLLAAAGCVLGFIDMVVYLIEKGLRFVADLLVGVDEYMTAERGQKWWVGTLLEGLAPKKS